MKSNAAAALAATLIATPALAADPAPAKNADGGYSAVQLARYCDKLEQGPQAYAAYVKRMKRMHPYYSFDDLGGTASGRPGPRLACAVAVPVASAGNLAVATTATTFTKVE